MWSFMAMAALMGFGGSMHCAAMCGPLARAAAGPGWLGFQLGRLSSYTALGALAGSMHHLMAYVASAQDALRPIWTLSLVALALLGASWVVMGKDPGWFEQGLLSAWRGLQRGLNRLIRVTVGGAAKTAVAASADALAAPPSAASEFASAASYKMDAGERVLHFIPRSESGRTDFHGPEASHARLFWRGLLSIRALSTGACWAAIPCGLLYSAALVAWMSGSAWRGAAFMALFALSSSVFQIWVHRGRLPFWGPRWQGVAYRVAGTLTVLWAGVSLWSLVVEGLPPGELCISVF